MSDSMYKELLDAGVHFGHLKRKWHPHMAPYVFMEYNGIHIIDLYKTERKLKEAASAMKQIAKSGRKILFVATKKQAKNLVAEQATSVGMPYMTERWPGGMLTNFATIRRSVKKMATIDKMEVDGTFNNMSKRECLMLSRKREKLERNLGSIVDLSRLPAAVFIVDTLKEHIAVAEARKLNIPIFAMVDTNSDPRLIDFPIPCNDDATKSIEIIVGYVVNAIKKGLEERKQDKALQEKEKAEQKEEKEKTEENDPAAKSKQNTELQKPEVESKKVDIETADKPIEKSK